MTGIVLIGGKSSRFGKDKIVAEVRDKTLIEHVTDVIKPLFSDIILIGHRRDSLRSFRIVEDIFPGHGPLGGIYTALSVSDSPHCFVFAADMPNLSQGLIRHMISITDDHEIVIPIWSKGREPLHAVYHKRIMPVAGSLLGEKRLKIFDLLNKSDTLTIPEDKIRTFGDPEILFSNINTQQDITKETQRDHHRVK